MFTNDQQNDDPSLNRGSANMINSNPAAGLPDAVNQPAFPSPVLRQGEQLHETTIYRFRVRK